MNQEPGTSWDAEQDAISKRTCSHVRRTTPSARPRGPTIANAVTREVVYVPPERDEVIRDKLRDFSAADVLAARCSFVNTRLYDLLAT